MPISKIEFKEFRKMANKKTHIFAYNAVDGLKIASEINSDDIEFFRKASVNDCDFYEILFKHGNKKGSFIFSAEFESWLNPPKEEHKTGKWKCNFPEGTKFEQEIERVKDKVRTKSTETSDIWNFASVLDKLILGKIEKIFKNYKINGLIQNTTNKEVVVEGIKTTVQEKIDVPKAWMTLPTKTVPRPEDSKKMMKDTNTLSNKVIVVYGDCKKTIQSPKFVDLKTIWKQRAAINCSIQIGQMCVRPKDNKLSYGFEIFPFESIIITPLKNSNEESEKNRIKVATEKGFKNPNIAFLNKEEPEESGENENNSNIDDTIPPKKDFINEKELDI